MLWLGCWLLIGLNVSTSGKCFEDKKAPYRLDKSDGGDQSWNKAQTSYILSREETQTPKSSRGTRGQCSSMIPYKTKRISEQWAVDTSTVGLVQISDF